MAFVFSKNQIVMLTYNYISTKNNLGYLVTLATNMPQYQEYIKLVWFTLVEIIYWNDNIVNVNSGNASMYSLIGLINESMSSICTLISNQENIFSFKIWPFTESF